MATYPATPSGGPTPPPPNVFRKTRTSGTNVQVNKATLLVISADGNDWATQFQGFVDGRELKVFVTNWGCIHCEAYTEDPKLVVYIHGEDIKVQPDFVLFRSFPNDLHTVSYRNQVLALFLSGVGGVNTVRQGRSGAKTTLIKTVLYGMDRPVMHAEMVRVRDRLGKEAFPVIDCKLSPNLRSSQRMRLITMQFPTVLKVGSSYGGYGKMVANNQSTYSDVESILALSNDFFTEEPFIEHEYEFRVQVIGKHVRCFRRNSSSSWKNQQGNVSFEDHPWDDKYKIWIDECRQFFGGMDMFALDVLHTAEGVDYILEINDYAMGFDYAYEVEDLKFVRELTVQRMNEELCGEEKVSFIGQFVFSEKKRGDLKGITYLP